MQKIETKTVGAAGRIVIPGSVRQRIGVSEGDMVDLYADGNVMLIVKGGNDIGSKYATLLEQCSRLKYAAERVVRYGDSESIHDLKTEVEACQQK